MPTLVATPWPSGPVVVSTPGGQAVFGVAGALAVELAEALDVVERDRQLAQPLVLRVHRLHAGEMQHGVEQHRGVAVGEHEAVAVGPDGVVGIEAEEVLPQAVDHRRQGHRRAGMAGVGRLHGVHGEGADGVDDEEVGVLRLRWHGGAIPSMAHSVRATTSGGPVPRPATADPEKWGVRQPSGTYPGPLVGSRLPDRDDRARPRPLPTSLWIDWPRAILRPSPARYAFGRGRRLFRSARRSIHEPST